MTDTVTGEDKAIQTQNAADSISKALAKYSSGAVFFGLALYLARYFYHHVKEEDQEEQLEAFSRIVRSFSKYAHTDGHGLN